MNINPPTLAVVNLPASGQRPDAGNRTVRELAPGQADPKPYRTKRNKRSKRPSPYVLVWGDQENESGQAHRVAVGLR